MRAAIVAFCLSIGLCAQNPAPGWQLMPSQSGAPDVQYRLREEGRGLKLEIRAEHVDQEKWALHLWMGDPRIVEARQKHLAEVQIAIRDEEGLLRDKDHHDDYCQASLHKFLGEAFMAKARFRTFDPYAHVCLSFQTTLVNSAEGLRQLALTPGNDEDGRPILFASIPFRGDFDAASDPIETLSYGLAYLPRDAGSFPLPGLRYPHLLPLQHPWELDPFLADWTGRFRLLLGAPEPGQIYLNDHGRYSLGFIGQIYETACSGAEGVFLAPDFWSPWPRDSEVELPKRTARFKFSFVKGRGSYLAVQSADQRDPVVLDLHTYLSSLGEEGIELLDCIDAPSGTSVLINVSGLSNPYGGGGQCGAGSQTDEILLRLASSGKLTLAKGFNLMSCDDETGVEFKGDNADETWSWKWKLKDRHEMHIVSYDPHHPELGITERDEPIKGD